MRILTKAWMGREDGRIQVVNHNKVIFSTHYRNLEHREILIQQFTKLINKG